MDFVQPSGQVDKLVCLDNNAHVCVCGEGGGGRAGGCSSTVMKWSVILGGQFFPLNVT